LPSQACLMMAERSKISAAKSQHPAKSASWRGVCVRGDAFKSYDVSSWPFVY